jgi:hypothetical protein
LKASYENKCADVAALEERLAEKDKELIELWEGLDVHQNVTESKFSELVSTNADLKQSVKDLTAAATSFLKWLKSWKLLNATFSKLLKFRRWKLQLWKKIW